MKIELDYNKGNTRVLDNVLGTLRYPGTNEKPIRARVSKDVEKDGFVWNKILLALNIEYGFDIKYLED